MTKKTWQRLSDAFDEINEQKNKELSEKAFDLIGDSVTIYLEKKEGLIRVDYPNIMADTFTLGDVYEAYQSFDGLIYVFADGGLRGEIYRCNNYGKGKWQKYAITQGYA